MARMVLGGISRSEPGGLHFLKMHGLGNDFVIIDARARGARPMTPALARLIGDRRRGVGFDQLAEIYPDGEADARIVFWNADGSTAGACGNASRCLARLMMAESGRTEATLGTERGLLACRDAGGGLIEVNMGAPKLGWRDVPLAREMDTAALDLPGAPGAASMGNPHCVFFVDDAETAPVAKQGPSYEHHALFPERANISFAEVRARDLIRLRVWERGAGETLACGSGACAVAVAAHRRGLTDRRVTLAMNGGDLVCEWTEDGVLMTGPTTLVGSATLSPEFLAGAE
ncbi:MAG: diaminopimelate epimerase [Pseudomonadota bacterium]